MNDGFGVMPGESVPGEFVPGGEEIRELGPTEDFEEAMKGAEEVKWDVFGNRVEGDEPQNGVQNDGTESGAVGDIPLVNKADEMMNGNEYNQGIADAAAIINYGLNAAARERDVESVVQGIKKFVVTGSNDVIGDLFRFLGIDTPAEMKELREEARATRTSEEAFLAEQGVQGRGRYSNEDESVFIMVISKYEISKLLGVIREHDPAAFILLDENIRVEGHFIRKLT